MKTYTIKGYRAGYLVLVTPIITEEYKDVLEIVEKTTWNMDKVEITISGE